MTDLSAAFELCRQVTEEHGKTYALATRLLPQQRRLAIWSLYAWARSIDDYVDMDDGEVCPVSNAPAVEAKIRWLNAQLKDAVGVCDAADLPASLPADCREHSATDREKLIIAATASTLVRWDISTELTDAFLSSMLMDIPGTADHIAHFRTWRQLDSYMWGSAAVIGLEVLPILGTKQKFSRDDAAPFAAELGRAFQVTNFIRDIAEDIRRERVYLPLDEWEAFGVTADDLRRCVDAGSADNKVRAAIAHFIAVNRAMYAKADRGIEMLTTPSCHAIRTARVLYSEILDEIEKADYDVFAARAVVSTPRKLQVAIPYGTIGAARWLLRR